MNFRNEILRGLLAIGAIICILLAGAIIAAAEFSSLNQPVPSTSPIELVSSVSSTTLPTSTPTPTDKPTQTPSSTSTVAPSNTSTVTQTSTPTACLYPQNWQPYTVKAKDTLSSLAKKRKISVEELLQGNCMKESTNLTAGTVIYLPELKVDEPTQPPDTLPTVLPVPISTVSG